MNIIFLGAPGTGKGTQAKLLSEELKIPHISTGDIFRENIKNQTELGKKASEFINKGLLVPDEITNEMIKERLIKDDCKNGFILDGYPRTIAQAEFLKKITKIDKIINFELDDEEIIKRISGRRTCLNCNSVYNIYSAKPKKENICDRCGLELKQREDEKPEVVKKRLEVYKNETKPLLLYYKKEILNINSEKKINEIFLKLKEYLLSK
ncbi:MAG: adenylate kinase [Candidatus Woesearchaeota archaeon]